ncbi:PD-(D/E)XK nuclease family protein [Piscirickettsia litoralis]|uniref:DNA repair protein n=1 Tax=Piscirickettsia litoralis TaxID=1891921 RepID=A0ABX3A4H0_9GAMM|nr:PD-(D/E)XK nuclease family protein [Piscirickettsia litoralis]ODN43767.1 DNA repair protein [Piscirickettsia litoralis]
MKSAYLPIIDLLVEKTLIVTPNLRLQDCLRFVSQEQEVVEEPAIYAWSSWCDLLWNELEILSLGWGEELPLVLNNAQEQALWETVIGGLEEDVSKTSTLVKLAMTANRRLHEWQLAIEEIKNYPMQYDAERFLNWQAELVRRMQLNHWLFHCERWDVLNTVVSEKKLAICYETIVFVGFDTFTPQQLAWIRQLLELGITSYSIFEAESTNTAHGPQLIVTNEPRDEFYLAAEWAEQLTRQYPEKTIGIVVPDLTEQRARIEQVFNDVFAPLSHLPGSPYSLRKVNISGGFRLDGQPLVQIITDLLTLFIGKTPELLLWQRLLQSPFIRASEAEQFARLAVLNHLVEQRQATISVQYVLKLLDQYEALDLSAALKSASYWMKEHYQKRYPPEHWAIVISRLLLIMGWPGERVLNSEEYQIATKLWPEVLDECVSLSGFCKPLTFLEMIAHLKQSLFSKVTQTRSDITQVYVFGLLEASGQKFDALWVTGLYDGLWPAPADLHPLLPARLQVDYDMPHNSPERELQLTERLFKRLLGAAEQVVISLPTCIGELELRPSALIEHLAMPSCDEYLSPRRVSFRESLLGASLESLLDEQGSKLAPGAEVSGGTQVIRSQLSCPFQAYGLFRLNARGPEPIREGLLLSDQGTLLHAVLDRVWQRIQNSNQLKQLTDESCHRLVTEVVRGVIGSWQKKLKGVAQTQWQLEEQRLIDLVIAWLTMEKLRELDFDVVGIETRRTLSLAGFSFQLRIDRVDDTEVGALLWDYKSSDSAKMAHWFNQPMQEPQLPLYALTQDVSSSASRQLAGFGFAKVLAEGGKFNALITEKELDLGLGVGEHSVKSLDYFKEKSADCWPEQLQYWQETFERTAANFGQGQAQVLPSEQACQYCELKPLCRIQERSQ